MRLLLLFRFPVAMCLLAMCLLATSSCTSSTKRNDESPDGAVVLDASEELSTSLVVVTLNTHSFQEGADSLEKLQAIGEGLAQLDADVVCLNEVMSGTFWAYDYGGAQHDGTAIIKAALEDSSAASWHVAEYGFANWADGEEMSNVILSRQPLLGTESREISTTDSWPAPTSRRNVVHGRSIFPEIGPVNLFCTHTWGWDSVDTLTQIDEVKSYIGDKRQGDEALEIVFGDLNVLPTSVAYPQWTNGSPTALVDTYAAANPAGFEDSTVLGEDGRIDYILVGQDAFSAARPSLQLRSSLVFDGADLPPVSDHKGVMTEFRVSR